MRDRGLQAISAACPSSFEAELVGGSGSEEVGRRWDPHRRRSRTGIRSQQSPHWSHRHSSRIPFRVACLVSGASEGGHLRHTPLHLLHVHTQGYHRSVHTYVCTHVCAVNPSLYLLSVLLRDGTVSWKRRGCRRDQIAFWIALLVP